MWREEKTKSRLKEHRENQMKEENRSEDSVQEREMHFSRCEPIERKNQLKGRNRTGDRVQQRDVL